MGKKYAIQCLTSHFISTLYACLTWLSLDSLSDFTLVLACSNHDWALFIPSSYSSHKAMQAASLVLKSNIEFYQLGVDTNWYWIEHPPIKADRLGLIPCICGLFSLVLGVHRWVQGTVHARCCHWLATSAAFTAKVAAWSTAQVSGDRRRWALVTFQKEYQANTRITKLTCPEL